MHFLDTLNKSLQDKKISQKIFSNLAEFYQSYREALEKQGYSIEEFVPLLLCYLQKIEEQRVTPHVFELFHEAITAPFDYYRFGLDFLRPLVVFSQSKVVGEQYINEIEALLAKGDNAILLANHQTEPDPQAISLLLEKKHPVFAQQMIFVAGHRVTTDPLCIPFSMGRNLLCIYSKKYIEHDPTTKLQKLQHNQRTMQTMEQLLAGGGKLIYVAPSGGRDRPNSEGRVDVAPFDSKSVEMFRLIARSSGVPTHFYPLSLATYSLLPPPNSVRKELGEERHMEATPIHMAFGPEFDMNKFDDHADLDKREKREKRAKEIWDIVRENYKSL